MPRASLMRVWNGLRSSWTNLMPRPFRTSTASASSDDCSRCVPSGLAHSPLVVKTVGNDRRRVARADQNAPASSPAVSGSAAPFTALTSVQN